jgi:hypothetical protein
VGRCDVIPQQYEIRVRGTLPPALLTAFTPLTSHTEDEGCVTVLTGPIGDQGELIGTLQTLDGLGLTLLEVRPVEHGHQPASP